MSAPFGILHAVDWRWVWLEVAAFLAGVLNAVAGGGSLLLFPAMLGMKMLPIQANATNTVALWPGQLTSIAAYRKDIRKNVRLALPMALAGLLGGMAGATLLLRTPQHMFLHLVPWLLLAATSIFAISGPITRRLATRRLAARRGRLAGVPHKAHRLRVFLATAAVCVYIGYFGAGAGFLLITVISLFGYDDLHEINALKVVSSTMANGIAFAIFVVNGQVVWRYCLLAMVTCGIGGYASASLARRVPQPALRGFVIAVGIFMTVWFFWKVG
ncbi:MAG TPA: sulfite exporter TauE/SafE family protein [Terracidiphilus sp.]|nr:sulfite exporter TauE/SafE family protein [Terracidiphilus sp.]